MAGTNEFTTATEAIENWLETAAGTPFVEVVAAGWALHPDQIGEQLERSRSPGAVVYYGGGEANKGRGGMLSLDPGVCVAVVARGRSTEAASQGDAASVGLNDLVKFVKDLHGKPLAGLQNPLYLAGVAPFILPWRALTVAAVVMQFSSQVTFSENLT